MEKEPQVITGQVTPIKDTYQIDETVQLYLHIHNHFAQDIYTCVLPYQSDGAKIRLEPIKNNKVLTPLEEPNDIVFIESQIPAGETVQEVIHLNHLVKFCEPGEYAMDLAIPIQVYLTDFLENHFATISIASQFSITIN